MGRLAQKTRSSHFDAARADSVLQQPPIVRQVLSRPGRPLDPALRGLMEPRYGHDFSGVRVHTNAEAAESARAIGAAAYTAGRDIVFGAGRFTPQTQEGRQLITHELMHVVRQSGAPGGEAGQTLQRQPLHDTSADTGPGPAVQGAGDVSVYVGATMTAEGALREIYRRAAREISEEAVRRVASGTPLEEVARWANQARNDLKVAIRARGSDIVRGLAEARNINTYGNKVGPSYEQLIREGKTPEDIVGSAGKANRKLNRVGTKLKVGGAFFIAVDVAIVTWDVISAPEGERLRTAVAGGAGIAGAAGGGWAGAKGGAAVGSFFGPVGTVAGGIIGGVGGALLGGWLGSTAGAKTYDFVEDLVGPKSGSAWNLQTIVIDGIEDQYIRQQSGSGK